MASVKSSITAHNTKFTQLARNTYNSLGGTVNLKNYSSSNPYTCPYDGHIITGGNGAIRLVDYGLSVTSTFTFVKKGMRLFGTGATSSDTAQFIAIKYKYA